MFTFTPTTQMLLKLLITSDGTAMVADGVTGYRITDDVTSVDPANIMIISWVAGAIAGNLDTRPTPTAALVSAFPEVAGRTTHVTANTITRLAADHEDDEPTCRSWLALHPTRGYVVADAGYYVVADAGYGAHAIDPEMVLINSDVVHAIVRPGPDAQSGFARLLNAFPAAVPDDKTVLTTILATALLAGDRERRGLVLMFSPDTGYYLEPINGVNLEDDETIIGSHRFAALVRRVYGEHQCDGETGFGYDDAVVEVAGRITSEVRERYGELT